MQWENAYLAMRLEVRFDKHVEIFANGIFSGVPKVNALKERQ